MQRINPCILQNIFKIGLVIGIFSLLFTNGLFADEFDNINDIMGGGDKAGKKALGTIVIWGVALILPVICIISGAIMGYSFQKKKSEQEQNTTKLYVVTGGAAIVGFMLFIGVTMIISTALLGDKSAMFQVITNFWRASLGL